MPSAFLLKLLSASTIPVVEEITWPKDLQLDHPIRDLFTHIRLWPTLESKYITDEIDRVRRLPEPDNDWIDATMFWAIALGLSTPTGGTPFEEYWLEIAEGFPDYPRETLSYKAIGEHLSALYKGPLGYKVMQPLYYQIMEFNGYFAKRENTDAKNSDGTKSSKPA